MSAQNINEEKIVLTQEQENMMNSHIINMQLEHKNEKVFLCTVYINMHMQFKMYTMNNVPGHIL